MNDVDFPVADVLASIEAAQAAGLRPIKINMVVKRGTNEQEILPIARYFRGTGVVLRFIEYMVRAPLTAGAWTRCCHRPMVVKRVAAEFPLRPYTAIEGSRVGPKARAKPNGPDDLRLTTTLVRHPPACAPEQDAALLIEAGFTDVELFHSAFTFKGWGCGRKLGLPGGSSCIPTKIGFEPLSSTSSWANASDPPSVSSVIQQRIL